MKQNKQAHLERTNQLITLGESIFNQVSPIFEEEEFDDRIKLKESVSETIQEKRRKISEIDNKKEELILKIIGQLHNGVLIKDRLSFRKGNVYEYRCHHPTGISTIKEYVMKNLHEVSEKLTKPSLDILEYVLQKHYTNPNSRFNNKEERQKIIKFPELKIIEKDSENIAKREFNIITLNGLMINDSGDIQFFYEHKEDGELKTEFPDFESGTFAGLYIKFENEIEDNSQIFIQELDNEILNAEKEIAEITEKGQNQLALCELTQGDVKGYGR